MKKWMAMVLLLAGTGAAENLSDGPAMVQIPAGTNVGTDPDFGAYSLKNASPFRMDRYAVSNDEMVRVMRWAFAAGRLSVSTSSVQNATGSVQELLDLDDPDCQIVWDGSDFGLKANSSTNYPCVEVTWYGAAAYCNYRSEMEGRTACYNLSDWSCNFEADGYRLPTSEEWEYAARGGFSGRRFPWGGTITHSNANYNSSSFYDYDTSATRGLHPDYPRTSPVAAFAPNGYGLYNMAGNVWEWCWDANGPYQFIRGGCWIDDADCARCGSVGRGNPASGSSRIGFRTVCRSREPGTKGQGSVDEDGVVEK